MAITQSRDKLYSLQLLLHNGVDIPTTGFANSPLDTDDLIKMVGGTPLIVKLLEGTQGKGVVLAETKKAAESVINAFKSLNANILVQGLLRKLMERICAFLSLMAKLWHNTARSSLENFVQIFTWVELHQ
jgi:glutathione synthase/RimK-type ligase-like ATP-grasp enzyme